MSWIIPTEKLYGSAQACVKQQLGKCSTTTIGCVVGSDRAKNKCKRVRPGVVTICVDRPGSVEELQKELERSSLAISKGSFLMSGLMTNEVSSTLVRQKLRVVESLSSREEKERYLNRMVEENLIFQSTADYLVNLERIFETE